jgi:lysophospholipase L1-like esterase
MCIGDSITFGNGNKTIAFGGYREPLRRLLEKPVVFVGRQHCGYPLVAPNEGYPGWSAGDIAAIAKQGAALAHPNIVLYMAGVNDFNPYHTDTVDQAANEEVRCIRNIAAGAPEARIYVATLIPLRPNMYISPESATELSNRIPGIVQNLHSEGIKCTLVDMAADVHLNPTDYDSINVHPSDSGCVKEARVWAAALLHGK